MAYPTLQEVRQRTAYLRGETDYTTTNAVIDSHINWTIKDIVLAYPFSWDLTTTTISLAGGTATLPADFIAKWGLMDARIVGSSTNDDYVFTAIDPRDRDSNDATSYIYWITYNTATSRYIFNSKTLTGTVTIYYYFYPADLSATSDTCIVPDTEAVAFLAAAKNWVGDERNTSLQENYEKRGASRVQDLWKADLQFGAEQPQGSVVDYNSQLMGG